MSPLSSASASSWGNILWSLFWHEISWNNAMMAHFAAPILRIQRVTSDTSLSCDAVLSLFCCVITSTKWLCVRNMASSFVSLFWYTSHLLWQVASATTFRCLLSLPGPFLPLSFPPFLDPLGTLTCGSGENTVLGCKNDTMSCCQASYTWQEGRWQEIRKTRVFRNCHLVLPFFHLKNRKCSSRDKTLCSNSTISQANCFCNKSSLPVSQGSLESRECRKSCDVILAESVTLLQRYN